MIRRSIALAAMAFAAFFAAVAKAKGLERK